MLSQRLREPLDLVWESGYQTFCTMRFALIVISALATLANQMVVQAADLTCVFGPHHKASPSPEPDIRADTACSRYSSLSCCSPNVSHSIDQQGDQELYNFHWDDCGEVPPECERFLKADSCFFHCDPYIGQWKGSEELSVVDLPICASNCDEFFEACKDVAICAPNWLTGFKEDNETGRFHCVNKTCRTFAEWYGNGKEMCETMWGDNQYVAHDNCVVMTFTGNNPNANVKKDTSGAHGIARWQSSLYFVLSVLSYILLQF